MQRMKGRLLYNTKRGKKKKKFNASSPRGVAREKRKRGTPGFIPYRERRKISDLERRDRTRGVKWEGLGTSPEERIRGGEQRGRGGPISK